MHTASIHTTSILALLLAAAVCPAWAGTSAKEAGMSFGAPVATQKLDGLRGGSDMTANDQRLNGTTAANTAREVQTGNNMISDGALSGMMGIPVVIQNTGANVLIQNAVIQSK